jgi:putative acetyltransferase
VWQVRAETPADHAAIYDLTKRAFAPMSFAAGDEQDLINALRAAGKLILSNVIEHEGRVSGHVAFSRMLSHGAVTQWFALGPIAVEPALQRRGMGSALIKQSLEHLRQRQALGVCLVGNPAYYEKFGFKIAPDHCPQKEPKEYFQLLSLSGSVPGMKLEFDPAFYNEA